MNDLRILENLFQKHDDEIYFELFKRSNIVSINNENQGDYNKEIIFNTRSLASLLINYKDAYILLKIEVKIPYDGTDQGKKSVPKLISLKKSFELIEYLRISLNNVIVKEVELYENDHIRYLKMLNDGYSKTINFLECHTRIFNDKMSEMNENFYVNNVQNCDSVYMYGILNTNKERLKYDLPSVKFEKPYLNIDNIKFENPIENDISAYDELKNKSNHYDNFLITYPNFKNYYRIYCFNVSRNIRDDHNNKFINIITNMETTSCVVYIVLKTHSSVKLQYSKSNGLVVYKSQ